MKEPKKDDGGQNKNVDDFGRDKEKYIEEMKKFRFATEVGLAKTSAFFNDAMKAQQMSISSE